MSLRELSAASTRRLLVLYKTYPAKESTTSGDLPGCEDSITVQILRCLQQRILLQYSLRATISMLSLYRIITYNNVQLANRNAVQSYF